MSSSLKNKNSSIISKLPQVLLTIFFLVNLYLYVNGECDNFHPTQTANYCPIATPLGFLPWLIFVILAGILNLPFLFLTILNLPFSNIFSVISLILGIISGIASSYIVGIIVLKILQLIKNRLT